MKHKRFLLVEFLLVVALSIIFVPVLNSSYFSLTKKDDQSDQRQQANDLLNQAKGAIMIIKENDWSYFEINGIYHPEVYDKNWILVAGEENINGFSRYIVIDDAYGAKPDPLAKKIKTVVSWGEGEDLKIESSFYLTP
jgi:hypothetical protein